MSRRWTPEMDSRLMELYETHTRKEICDIMGKTAGSVRGRMSRLGLNTKVRGWSDDEVEKLKDIYASLSCVEDMPLDVIAAEIGRSRASVACKANDLGLTDLCRPVVKNRKIRKPMFDNAKDRASHMSSATKEYIAKNGHPKGMLGKKHSEATKARIAVTSKERADSETDEQKSSRIEKGLKTKVARYGSIAPKNLRGSWKAAWREIGGIRKYYRSAWEANYARYLEWLLSLGEIKAWEHEPETFWFEGIKRGVRSYLPDFRVTENSGEVVYHEVKGYMDKKSKTKIKRMAKYHPDVRLIVIDSRAYNAIKKKVQSLIDGWETDSKGR